MTDTPSGSISAQLAVLPSLPMAELWALWNQHFPRRPSHRNRHYVESRLAYRIQEKAYGALPTNIRKMVDVFDRHRVSFSAVTQQINSATSMDRLMLNVLLFFAQFEREVTGERIRDKIAASKRKGMWMGGPLPLAYDVHDRMLVLNEVEATLVRRIFDDFATIRSATLMAKAYGAELPTAG